MSATKKQICATLGGIFLITFGYSLPLKAGQSKLDQQYANQSNNLIALINEGFTYVGQTYTASQTGCLGVVSIDVRKGSEVEAYPLRVAIYDVVAGTPTSQILGQTVLKSSSSSLSDLVTFPKCIGQVAGDQYAVVVNYVGAPSSGAGQVLGSWTGSTTSPYSGGASVFSNDTISWTVSTGDLYFRTYVQVTQTSQP